MEKKRVWNEDAFNAAKWVYMQYGFALQEVATEMGLERAMNIFLQSDARGRRVSRIQQLLGSKEIDLTTFAAQSQHGWNTVGFDAKTEATPTSTITTTKKCPLYEGFLEAGIDHDMIETFCRLKDDIGDAQYKQSLDPYAGIKMHKFRSGSDDYCIEETILKLKKE
jgi:hypothetical protein